MSWSSSRFGGHRPLAAARAAAVVLAAGFAVVVPAASASAAVTTIYASPTGTGSACSSAQPCSLSAAQAAVRSQVASMSGDIVVQLADGVYRPAAPLTFTSADSGTGGHTVSWQAAPSAHPVITGAKAVTGWSLADSSKNIWKASVGTGLDTRQLYVDGAEATRARTTVNRSDFTASATGLRFTSSSLNYLNNLAHQNRVEVEGVGSFTDRYSPVQSIGSGLLTMQQPAWNNNAFGYDTLTSPFRAGPLYLENAYEFLDSPGEWYDDTSTGTLYYIPRSGQTMSTTDVELPMLQSLVDVGGTYDSPAHDVSFSGITFTGTSWLGPSGSQGYADQQTGAYLSGNRSWPSFGSCQSGLHPVRGRPAALEPDARGRAGVRGQPHHLQRRPVRQPRARPRWASAMTPTPTPPASAWARAPSPSPGPPSPATPPARSWPAAYRPTRTTPATSA